MDRNELLLKPHHLGVPSGASKMISEPMVCLVQTVHVPSIKISTISKRTEMSFHLSLITSEYHQVHLKWFLSLWHVQRKPCMYLASRLALSSNGPKQASTWASSSCNSIGCIQNYFLACGTFAELMHLSCTYTNTISKQSEMRFKFHPVHRKQFLSLWYVRHKPHTYLPSRLSPNGPKWVSTRASSPRSTIGCNQNNFWAYGTLAQIVQLSCTYTNTISKSTKTRFQVTHVT
jgi:hypothetical protein